MLLVTAVFGAFLVVPSWGPAPSDVLWPELALVVWLTVVVFIAVTRRSGRVRSAITANRYLLLNKGLLLALLIPAYFGRLSLGVPVVGMAVLHLSVAFARPLLGLLTIGFFAGITLIPAELALLAIGNSPRLAELPVLGNISDKLYHRFRRVLQWEPECSRFDAELLYTLRPGECVFENVEFSTRIHVNRLGLRDDDASLDKPAVIVLGDSAAAGWGVEQQEVFAHQLEILTGLKTLNVSASSYGTPREFKLFERVDRSGLRYVVL